MLLCFLFRAVKVGKKTRSREEERALFTSLGVGFAHAGF
jgi:hypothetical protein